MNNRLFLFCLLAVFATSCVNELQDDNQDVYDAPVFYATIEQAGEPSTKVFADDSLRVLWNADDRVSIFNKSTYNRQYRFDGQDGDNSGVFKKVPTEDFVVSNPLGYVYSVYPYSESTSISNDGEITVFLPAAQSYREDSFGLGANTMIAITEDDELMFKNLCGYFAIKLYGDGVTVSSISLKGNGNEFLAGKATVVAQMDAAPTVQFDEAGATKELTLTCAAPVTLGATAETATVFWFVIPPTTFENGFTLTVNDNRGGIFRKVTSNPLEIKRNRLKKTAALEVEMEGAQPNNVIYYTSTDGAVVTPNATDVFGANIISNEYIDGRGVITFDGDVLSIGGSAFSGCKSLVTINLPNSVTKIGNYSFSGCSSLAGIAVPEGVTSLGNNAFYNCSSLASISIPEGVTSLGSNAFYKCSSLTSITIPESVTSIGNGAFGGCSSLFSFSGKYATQDGLFLIDSGTYLIAVAQGRVVGTVVIPEDVMTIGDGVFSGCTSLISIIIPQSINRIGSNAFSGCSNLASIAIPESVMFIGMSAFSVCSSLTHITIPRGLKTIPAYAFSNCKSLANITIPEGVTTISRNAFVSCTSLTSITIPRSVTSIENSVFGNCSNLACVYLLSTTPPSAGTYLFNNTNIAHIFVPAISESAYESARNWSDYAEMIQPLAPLPEAIDLGLSVKWASFNLGASSPEGYGNYYAWGEVLPKEEYSWTTYKWCYGRSNRTLTKYNHNESYGIVDNKYTLDPEDDAAYVSLGENWRIPSTEEGMELWNNSSCTWTRDYNGTGVAGMVVTSTKPGYTDKSVFFPAIGYDYNGGHIHDIPAGVHVLYWYSSEYDFGASSLFDAAFGASPIHLIEDRCYGLMIRPVCD